MLLVSKLVAGVLERVTYGISDWWSACLVSHQIKSNVDPWSKS